MCVRIMGTFLTTEHKPDVCICSMHESCKINKLQTLSSSTCATFSVTQLTWNSLCLLPTSTFYFAPFFFVHNRLFILTSVVSVDKQLRIVKRAFLTWVASRREKKTALNWVVFNGSNAHIIEIARAKDFSFVRLHVRSIFFFFFWFKLTSSLNLHFRTTAIVS